MFSCTIYSCCQTTERTEPEHPLAHTLWKLGGKKMWPKTSQSWMAEGPILCTAQFKTPKLGAPYHDILSHEPMRGLATHWRVGLPCYSVCKFPLLPHRPSQVSFKTLAELGTCILKKTEDNTSLLDGKYTGLPHLVCSRHNNHLWGTNLLSNPSFSEGLWIYISQRRAAAWL